MFLLLFSLAGFCHTGKSVLHLAVSPSSTPTTARYPVFTSRLAGAVQLGANAPITKMRNKGSDQFTTTQMTIMSTTTWINTIIFVQKNETFTLVYINVAGYINKNVC